jgi:glycosyltransferase involved in cell wall biosynthesis
MSPELSLVLPAYNSVSYIKRNVARTVDFFDRVGLEAELLVADDGSTDGTADAVPIGPNVRVLRLPHRGKGGALRSGMAAARGEIRAFTDADLPFGLDPLPLAVRWIRERGYHAVIGDRTLPGSRYKTAGAERTLLSSLASFVFRTLVTGGIYDTQCGLKVFRGDVAAEVFRLARVDGFAIDVEVIYLLLKYRLDIKRMPVQMEDSGPSTVRVLRDSVRAARDVVSIRLNWASGRYRSDVLEGILRDDLRADLALGGSDRESR